MVKRTLYQNEKVWLLHPTINELILDLDLSELSLYLQNFLRFFTVPMLSEIPCI